MTIQQIGGRPSLTAASTVANAPYVDVAGPVVQPAGYGLLAAATVLPAPELAGMFGVDWQPPACGVAQSWPIGCTDDALPAGGKTFYDLPSHYTQSDPFLIYYGEECGSVGGAPADDARVRAGLQQSESRAVEAHIWPMLIDAADDLGAGRGIVDGLGHLEEELGNRIGGLGIIHAPKRVAAHAAANHLIVYDGPVARTPSGHAWAFGGGYDPSLGGPPSDGASLVATGPMTIWRTDVFTFGPTLDRSQNLVLALAERIYMAGWACAEVRMAVPLSA